MDSVLKKYGIDEKEAERYIEKFRKIEPHKFAVIKVGGESIVDGLSESLAFLSEAGLYPVIVHGGGNQIDNELKKRGIKARKINGVRVTDEKTLYVVSSVISDVNEKLVESIKKYGGKAVSVKNALIAEKMSGDYGLVGEIIGVKSDIIKNCINEKNIPVLWCLSYDNSQIYNTNADVAANAVFFAMSHENYIMLTKKGGIENNGHIVSQLSASELKDYIAKGIVNGGMRYKSEKIIEAIEKRGCTMRIISPENLLAELLTEKGHGTYISR